MHKYGSSIVGEGLLVKEDYGMGLANAVTGNGLFFMHFIYLLYYIFLCLNS